MQYLLERAGGGKQEKLFYEIDYSLHPGENDVGSPGALIGALICRMNLSLLRLPMTGPATDAAEIVLLHPHANRINPSLLEEMEGISEAGEKRQLREGKVLPTDEPRLKRGCGGFPCTRRGVS